MADDEMMRHSTRVCPVDLLNGDDCAFKDLLRCPHVVLRKQPLYMACSRTLGACVRAVIAPEDIFVALAMEAESGQGGVSERQPGATKSHKKQVCIHCMLDF